MLGYTLTCVFLSSTSLGKCVLCFWLTCMYSFSSELSLVYGEGPNSDRAIKCQWVTRMKEAPWRKMAPAILGKWCWSYLNLLHSFTYVYWNSADGTFYIRIYRYKIITTRSVGPLVSHSLFQPLFRTTVMRMPYASRTTWKHFLNVSYSNWLFSCCH